MASLTNIFKRFTGDKYTDEQQQFLRSCAKFDEARLANYSLYERYYNGDQPTHLTEREKTYLEANGVPFTENYCETVIDEAAEKMEALGFEPLDANDEKPEGADEQQSDGVDDWLIKRWEDFTFDDFQSTIWTNTFMKADGWVLVDFDWNAGRSRMTWNNPELIEAHYDDNGNLELVVKKWNTCETSHTNPDGDAIVRMNLYYEDRVEKYFAVSEEEGADWSPHIDHTDYDIKTEAEQWPIWWTDTRKQDGEPLGILAFHFRNKPKGKPYGRSELRGAIPFQNEIDKQCVDLHNVMDSQGWPARYVTGATNESGEALTINPGEILTLPAGADAGQFDPVDPTRLTSTIEATLRRMATKTKTAFNDLDTNTQPNAEARKTANDGAVKRARDRQKTWGSTLEDSWTYSHKLEFLWAEEKPPAIPEGERLKIIWRDPEGRNELDFRLQLEAETRLGLSKETALNKIGYDGKAELEKSAAETAAATEAAQKAFDQGKNLADNPYGE